MLWRGPPHPRPELAVRVRQNAYAHVAFTFLFKALSPSIQDVTPREVGMHETCTAPETRVNEL